MDFETAAYLNRPAETKEIPLGKSGMSTGHRFPCAGTQGRCLTSSPFSRRGQVRNRWAESMSKVRCCSVTAPAKVDHSVARETSFVVQWVRYLFVSHLFA